jgi:HSP20 family protein
MTAQTATRYVTPRVDIYESPEAVTLEAELPGVSKDGAEIELHDGKLILQARREPRSRDGSLRVKERSETDYYREFRVSDSIDAAGISAAMKDGVLIVTLPKSEHLKPRVVAVN